MMAVSASGQVSGSVSGGCVEGAVILEAADERGPDAVPGVLRELAESARALARAD